MNFTLPKPKLGEITAITITTPDLETSLKYWQQLGFSEFMRADFPFPWIQITDGALLIMLRKDPQPYIALTYYVKDIEAVINDLNEANVKLTDMSIPAGLRRYRIDSPDGHIISLVNIFEGFVQPAGPTMLTMQPADYANPAKYVNKVCGMYGEFAHPVKDLDASIAFWEKLGFNVLSKFSSPYPWAILSDGLAVIGLHQSAQSGAPAITFFASDMKEKIEKLEAGGLKDFVQTTGTGAGCITLTTPEKQKVNLFKLGM